MRRGRGLVLMLWAALCVGCATEQPERSTSWLSRLRPLQPAPNSRLVQMEVALIERPVGDPYLNQELWDLVDEQVIGLERKILVADNGFRVGVIGGLPPAGLQALLTSERSCANPRRIQRHAGDATTLLLGLTIPHCRFRMLRDGEPETVELDLAQCTLTVTPSLASDGRTRLQFTPQVRHGETAMVPRPSVDRSGIYSWMLQEQRPTETYAHLSWEVTLAPNEYVVVGGRLDQPQTLGHPFFIRADEPNPVQRLLVIRTARMQPGLDSEDDHSLHRNPPLAIQAAMTGSREDRGSRIEERGSRIED